MEILRLDWDSNLFGIEVGKTNIDSYDDRILYNLLSNNDYNLIYIESEVYLDDRSLGPCYSKIIFKKKVSKDKLLELRKEDLKVETYSEGLIDQLLSLTYQTGEYSRFNLDENFINDEYKKLYKKWIESSLNGKIADTVQVVRNKDSKILGFTTIKFNTDYSEIGLIGVDKNSRGLGIGSLLLDRVNKLSIDNGVGDIYVATQLNNKPACKFYKKNGFTEIETKHIYHCWTKK